MPAQHSSASTSRRGSGNGKLAAGVAPAAVTHNQANRARMDANLRMSTKTTNEDAVGAAAAATVAVADRSHHVVSSHSRNKSSDRLHRLAAGHSSGNLASHGAKRSKSYSQIMNATGEKSSGASTRKNKLRRERSDGHGANGSGDAADAAAAVAKEEEEVVVVGAEEDGWTSADQTTSDSKLTHDESDREDDDIVLFGKKTAASAARASAATNDSIDESGKTQKSVQASVRSHRASEDSLAKTEPREESDVRANTVVPQSPTPEKKADETQDQARMARLPSTSSVRTLTGSGTLARDTKDVPTSPSTIASFNHRTSLKPRASHVHAAPPKLSTEYAFAGAGDSSEGRKRSLHRSSDSDVGALTASASDLSRFNGDRSTDSVPHYRFSTVDSGVSGPSASDFQIRARKTSISSARSSIINLPGVSPSLGTISHEKASAESSSAQTSRAIEAMQRATLAGIRASQQPASTLHRERTISTQSSGPAEAARLASKLRMTRSDSVDGSATSSPAHTTSASRLLANSGSKYFSANKADGTSARTMAKYNKPTISVFVRRQDDFKTLEKHVEHGNLFDERFARASLSGQDRKDDDAKDQADHGVAGRRRSNDKKVAPPAVRVRYLMDYGLSGPAMEKNTTTKALLSTCLDNDEFEASWAPALTQAAGLSGGGPNDRHASGGVGESSTTYAGMAAGEGVAMLGNGLGGGVFINGPNATPLHFLHGLTNTNDSPFPLDEADVGVLDAATGMTLDRPAQGEYVDAKNLRAVALTWAALNTTKNHIMTRRYVDPMRESLERVMEAAGRAVGGDAARSKDEYGSMTNDSLFGVKTGRASSPYHIHDHRSASMQQNVGGGASTPGGSLRWGWRSLFSEQTPHE